jgi:tetraacyldisaccharide 4'-kinase
MPLETYAIDVIEGRRRGQSLFYLLSFFYRAASAMRHYAYCKNWIKKTEVAACVVSVGNIVAGGTGKTPVVRLLAEELKDKHQIAILSRGYRGSIEKSNQILRVSTDTEASVCGDESLLLAQKLPGVSVWAGKKRSHSAQIAVKNGAEIILLDDGFQHRQLKRDFELIVMNAQDLFGKGYFLPRGYLRDAPERLAAADLIVVNAVQSLSEHEKIKKALASYTAAPIVSMRMRLESDLGQKTVGVFCGIGSPRQFLEGIRALGTNVVAEWLLPDHQAPTINELHEFALRSQERGAEAIVCTEKDAVKLQTGLELPLPLIVVEGKLEIIRGKNHWLKFIQRIRPLA